MFAGFAEAPGGSSAGWTLERAVPIDAVTRVPMRKPKMKNPNMDPSYHFLLRCVTPSFSFFFGTSGTIGFGFLEVANILRLASLMIFSSRMLPTVVPDSGHPSRVVSCVPDPMSVPVVGPVPRDPDKLCFTVWSRSDLGIAVHVARGRRGVRQASGPER